MQPRVLRDYQNEAVTAVLQSWTQPRTRRTSVVMATGLGKSTVIARLATLARSRGMRTLILAHREMLLQQMSDAVMALEPDGEEPGLVVNVRNDTDRYITLATFQTLTKSPHRLEAIGAVDVVLVDEAHHAIAPSYVSVLRACGLAIPEDDDLTASAAITTPANDKVVSCGFTATMSRADAYRLGHVWPSVAYERGVVWAVQSGYLVKPTGVTVAIKELDALASVTKRAGDYAPGELSDVMRSSVETTVDAIERHAHGRAMMVFAADIAHGAELVAGMRERGYAVEMVSQADSTAVREDIYARFHGGALDALVSVAILTEGADFPRCDCVVIARPTQSEVLFTQMVGRALRPYTAPNGDKKTEALILDLTGTARQVSVVSLTDLWGDDVDVRRVDTEGKTIPVDVPDEQRYVPEPEERRGRAELESIDLLATPTAGDKVVTRITPGGVLMVPGRFNPHAPTVSYCLWPPRLTPEDTAALVRITFPKGSRPSVDIYRDQTTGEVIWKPVSQALAVAKDLAVSQGTYQSWNAPRRRRPRPASDSQLRYARALGINPEGLMDVDVSDAIDAHRTDQLLSTHPEMKGLM